VAQPRAILDRPNGEHWAGRFYMRRLSIHLTRVAVRLGLTPNTVTGLMIVVGMLGAAALVIPGVGGAIICFLAIQLYLTLDCVDGEVARWTQMTSPAGIYLDRLGHYLVESAVVCAAGVRVSGLIGSGDLEWGWIVLGLVGAIGVLLDKAETDLVDSARLHAGLGPMEPSATTMTRSRLAAGRSLARWFPIHRITHAVEASIVLLLAGVLDATLGGLDATRVVAISFAVVIWAIVPLHLLSVLTSRRLVP